MAGGLPSGPSPRVLGSGHLIYLHPPDVFAFLPQQAGPRQPSFLLNNFTLSVFSSQSLRPPYPDF
jgi:hypothetical protein